MNCSQYETFLLFALFSYLGVSRMPTSPHVQQELGRLQRCGISLKFVGPNQVELRHEYSGFVQVKSLDEPSVAEIHTWADTKGVPIVEINPEFIDTSSFTGWYTLWTEVPLSNDVIPLVVGDIDGNGLAEVYGSYKDTASDYETRAYEIDSTGLVTLLHNYVPRPGVARQFTNADGDSLEEVTFTLGGLLSDYEQSIRSAIPTNLNFQHQRHQGPVDPGFTGVHIGTIDADTLTDFLYKGSEELSITKIYVAEYSPDSNNFTRVWSNAYVPGAQSGIAGFSVNDFDGDGFQEFVVSNFFGELFVTENTGDNEYAVTWQDSVPFVNVNVYYHGSGDVDGDNKSEFYVGATLSSGNWTTVYEADSNNSYSPKLIFHLLSGGTFDNPTYLVDDLDGNGDLELLIFSGVDLYVFKSDGDNQYYLWYFKRENGKDSIQLYDFNKDGRKDFIISKSVVNQQGQLRNYATAYLASGLVDATEGNSMDLPNRPTLSQNYPNPFNPMTHIEYSLFRKERVRLVVYDLLGSMVNVLLDKDHDPGSYHLTWNAINWPTGLYFYRLETPTWTITRKMLLVK